MLGIYCRISGKKEEGKDRSIEDQKQLGIIKAKELGLEYQLFIDEGITAFDENAENRPAFWKMLGAVTEGTISAVFAYDQSRFERHPQVRNLIKKKFKKHRIKWFTHIEGQIDLNNIESELFGDIMSLFNNYFVTLTKRKVESVLKRRVTEGKAHGINAYGYSRDENGILIIDEEEARTVKLIFDLSLKGMGTRSIANYLDEQNVLTRYNKIEKGEIKFRNKYTDKITIRSKTEIKWAGNTVRNIITNSIYYGKRMYGTTNDVKNSYDVPAIFNEGYWQMVNDNLKTNKNNFGKKIVHSYLLKGLIRCDCCGRNMYGRTRASKKDHYYMCSSKRIKTEICSNRSINIDRLDDFIWTILFGKENFITRLENEITKESPIKEKLISEISFEKKKLEAFKTEKQKSISLCIKGIISELDLTEAVKSIDMNIKNSEIHIKELSVNQILSAEGQVKLKDIKNKFEEYTKFSTVIQKGIAIREVIRNIRIKFEKSIYTIVIEYNFGLPTETWTSVNQRADLFSRVLLDEKGEEKGVLFSAPMPISNPKDDSTLNDFLNHEGLLCNFKANELGEIPIIED